MKLVKLNRTHKAFREHGHHWAFRWDSYSPAECGQVERIFQSMHGSQYRWDPRDTGMWKSNFGHPLRGHSSRPYWVSFRDQHDATVVLLKMG